MPDALPIIDCLDELTSVLAQSQPVVLQAPPGAGKTTGIPPALLKSNAAGDGKTLLIQPRRLAARAAAHRLATSMDCRLGDTVGYHVRFDKCHGKDTQLISMTTGMLLRRLQSDPFSGRCFLCRAGRVPRTKSGNRSCVWECCNGSGRR